MSRVFISYKRKDKEKVFPLVKEIEAAIGEKCWIDLDGIETSAQFTSVLCRAIDNAEVILFMHSRQHLNIDYDEDWTVKELNYARALKKRVVLIMIDDAPLKNIFLMEYGTKNNIDINAPEQKAKLLKDLCNWLKVKPSAPAAASTAAPSPAAKKSTGDPTVKMILDNINKIWGRNRYEDMDPADRHFVDEEPIAEGNGGKVKVAESGGSSEPVKVQTIGEPSLLEINGHKCVDLGLSVKWATCNIGASNPSEPGEYYSWGDSSVIGQAQWGEGCYALLRWTKYKHTMPDDSLKSYEVDRFNVKFKKYNSKPERGIVDNKTQLEAVDDVASEKWGGSWRMPTQAEVQELLDKCTWEWKHIGYKVVSKINGESIFLPAAGAVVDQGLCEAGRDGAYWTGTLYNIPTLAYTLFFKKGNDLRVGHAQRFWANTIRPVHP